MERLENLAAIAANKLPAIFADGYGKIMNYAAEHEREIVLDLAEALDSVIRKVSSHQMGGQKGPLEFINFSFLLSNMMLGQHGLQIDAYDSNYYLDELEASADWRPDWIFTYANNEFDAVIKDLKAAFPRVQQYELDEIKRVYLLNHYSMAIQVLCIILPRAFPLLNLSQVECVSEIKVSCGLYMERQQGIFTWEVEG